MSDILFRNAEVDGRSGTDVLVVNGTIVAIGPDLRRSTAHSIDARGGALIPGLTDHHLHLHAMAADADSVRCGPPAVRNRTELATSLGRASARGGWIRGVGYIETVAGELDCASLDALYSASPVRIQHRSGAMWMLNSVAVQQVGLASADHPGIERTASGEPTGRLWRADDWLRTRLPSTGPPDLTEVSRTLDAFGITAVTDATPDLTPTSQQAIADAAGSGALRQRVHLLGSPIEGPRPPNVTVGPYKIVLADSDPPDLTELAALIEHIHRSGRAVAAHCVSRENLLILLLALDQVGAVPGDRIEHGALTPEESIPEIRRHGLTVVTQPGFLADRGDDYLRDVDPRDVGDLYRCRSLVDAAVPLALSSDAPYGPSDPWANIASAVRRRTATDAVVGPHETLSATAALAAYLAPADDPGGAPRTVHVGAPADLVLLRLPLGAALEEPSAEHVRMTLPHASDANP
ncbi:amidohydrolase family protein [Rhodococcus cercidiphylli]|uniref:Amidohydrolase family protein n=1 Tax=Rhodococcus cercidiphylli TaxID=489916 RepID=A0ABU4AWI1_9NOCA|nr:amidohydrolase family protein [Rhodococcus cercidiphylli]MDV6230587.1 amidohydrolase family protein [Rhodococcus cercidiphylli]